MIRLIILIQLSSIGYGRCHAAVVDDANLVHVKTGLVLLRADHTIPIP